MGLNIGLEDAINQGRIDMAALFEFKVVEFSKASRNIVGVETETLLFK